MKKKIWGICLLSFFSLLYLFAQDSDYLAKANYQTAKRCVELARDQLVLQKYEEAFDFVEVGLSYDKDISDLWYLHALLLEVKKQEVFKQIESVQAALEKKSWLYYTPEAARIFYARYLIQTGLLENALEVLNQKPLLIQSDAEYLRALAYYRLYEQKKAREIIAHARVLFPKDARFPQLFFKHERLSQDTADTDFVQLRDSLLTMIDSWKKESHILLYASYFVGEEQALRYLKEYRLKEVKDPLYILAFLEYGLFTEAQAIDALMQTAEEKIDARLFIESLFLLESPQSFSLLTKKLETFSGRLDFDTNQDGTNDFFVRYKYGRPFTIVYDQNADDALNWIIECDYGLAEKAVLFEENYELYFSRYPVVDFLSQLSIQDGGIEMQFVDGFLSWEPYTLELLPIQGDLVFYLPVLQEGIKFPSFEELRKNANEIVIQELGDVHKKIRFSLKNDRVHTALYSLDNKPYAYAFFEDGILQFRNIDRDGNGSYETTEFYDFNLSEQFLSEEDQNHLYKELFGSFEMPLGYYLAQVLVDTNENGIPDFRENYFVDGTKTTAWDTNENGSWDLRYEKTVNDEKLLEKIFFINPLNNEEVEISLEDGVPQLVRYANTIKRITKEKDFPFYWLGNPSYTRHALKAFNELEKNQTQGLRLLVEDDEMRGNRILAIKIDNYYFGELIEANSF